MCTAPNIRCEVALRNALPVICARLVFAIFLGAIFVAGAPRLRAQSDDSQQSSQDVAGAARQERARKQNQETKHVYTNEDLRRGKILTPADQSRAGAKRKQPVAPTAKPDAEPLDADSNTPQEPLGDVARRYRNARRDTEKTSPFHLPSQQPELAAPKILAPLPKPLINPATKPSPKIFAPSSPSVPNTPGSFVPAPLVPSAPMRRVDPFSRRRIQPAPPAISGVRPVEPRVAAQPNFSAPSRPRPTSAVTSAPSIIVRQGDTLWTLSRQHLGRGTRWLELMAANPGVADPARLVPGTMLTLPPRMATHRSTAASITVQPGDSLSKIALTIYGHASYWPCIARANPTVSNPHRLSIGQPLALPASCTP